MDDLVTSQSQQPQISQVLQSIQHQQSTAPVTATPPVEQGAATVQVQQAVPLTPVAQNLGVQVAANSPTIPTPQPQVPPTIPVSGVQPGLPATRLQEPPSATFGHKEYAPMPPMSPDFAVEHKEEPLILSSEPDVLLPPELKEFGVEGGEDVREQAFFKAMQQAS